MSCRLKLCLCFSLRLGSSLIIISTLLFSLYSIANSITGTPDAFPDEFKELEIVDGVIGLSCTSIGLYGVVKEKPGFLAPFLIYYAISSTIGFILFGAANLEKKDPVVLFFSMASTAAIIWFFIWVIYSYYLELKEKRKTEIQTNPEVQTNYPYVAQV